MKRVIFVVFVCTVCFGFSPCAFAAKVKVVKSSDGWRLLKDERNFL